ncbi:MAG: ABC transporter permease [Pyrinomonadaceae bacterium]|nr:ABC transporter permease [Acidobacteriota bacterium]MBP7474062.1 ABC transporter permease [Pyrinomonadaceae bacterium]MBP9109919.1 ABC transporter permease [Pyrinomonadaceae bacterium]
MDLQRIKDTWASVADSIQSNKLRSGLTLTGVIIGTAVVALVGAVLTGLSQRVQEVSDKSAPNVIYFTKQARIGPSLEQPTAEERQRKDFSLADAIAVAELQSPQAVSPQKVRGSYGPSANVPKVTARSREGINPLILGVWENYPQVINVPLDKGRFFTETERRARASVAVIGFGISKQIFEDLDPLGEDVKIDGKLFRVIGVLGQSTGEGVIGSDALDERTIYIPFETSEKFYPEIEETLIAVRAPNGRVDEVTDEVSYLLRTRRGVGSTEPNDFGVNRSEQVFELVNDVINGLGVIVVPIALASLFVGGVGVMNVMLVSVKERTAEIGIKRALGARRRVILTQFLLEAITLTGIGGLIGIAVGLLLAFAVRTIISFPAAVPFWAIAAGFGASVLVGLVAGFYPALQASRLDPVEAMRRT